MANQYQKGFFEFIAAANAEKVHSQTIGWIFSENCVVFNSNEKSKILNELIFQSSEEIEDFKPTNVQVEIDDIDILIETEDGVIVIENKIKSSQHSNQLFKYEYITAQNLENALECYKKWKSIKFPDNNFKSEYLEADTKRRIELRAHWENLEKIKIKDLIIREELELKFREKKPTYIYLTLVKEKPESKNWVPVTYSRLHNVLSSYFKVKDQKNLEHYSIVKSYLSTIGNLSSVAQSFIDSPGEFEFVFKEGKTRKNQIVEKDFISGKSYIKELQLETLLQKWYYTNLIEKINETKNELLNNIEHNVGETRGTALLDFRFNEIKIEGVSYSPILQFQGNAIKLALAGSTKTETKGVSKRKEEFAERLKKIKDFQELFTENPKISTPRKEFGFLSININKAENFWQVQHSPEFFVTEKIKMAKKIFKEIEDK